MAAILALLHGVGESRNTLAPISRLPSEVLCRVFASCALIEEPWERGQGRTPRSLQLGWIKVTHVCRLWRQVALAYTPLWVNIRPVAINWIREFVLRSKQALVSVDLRDVAYTDYAAGVLRDVLPFHLPRVKGLALGGSSHTIGAFLELFEDTPGPTLALQSFHISTSRAPWFDFASRSRILQLTNPRALTRLVLENCIISSLVIPQFPSLTHFEINQDRPHNSGGYPFGPSFLDMSDNDWLFRVLLNMPRLETLLLGYTWNYGKLDGITTGASQENEVHLKLLRTLRITGLSHRRFQGLMSNLVVPAAAVVECEVVLGFRFAPVIQLVIQELKIFAPNVHTSEELLRTLSFSFLPKELGCRVQAWSSAGPRDTCPKLSITFNVSETLGGERVSYTKQSRIWHVIMNEFTTALDVKDVRSLTLPDIRHDECWDVPRDDEREEMAYLQLFRRMPSVQKLILSTESEVMLASLRALVAISPDTSEKMCFPQLRDLTLFKFNIHEDEIYSNLIESVLRSRRAHFGLLLDKLTLLGFYASQKSPDESFRRRFCASQVLTSTHLWQLQETTKRRGQTRSGGAVT